MSKSFDLSNKSDMRRFQKELTALPKKLVEEQLKKGIDTKCPNCSKTITIRPNMNVCRYCGQKISAQVSYK
jgi:DNA-directed RNA polymerase subunit RPC12/RpoP